jgi:hypothetical protein
VPTWKRQRVLINLLLLDEWSVYKVSTNERLPLDYVTKDLESWS